MLLSRDWSAKLLHRLGKLVASTQRTAKKKKVRIYKREAYMKYAVTGLEGTNESVIFPDNKRGNYCLDTFFGNFEAETLLWTRGSHKFELSLPMNHVL
jgi:hypothetical protein